MPPNGNMLNVIPETALLDGDPVVKLSIGSPERADRSERISIASP